MIERRVLPRECAELVREACIALRLAPPRLVTTISVTYSLACSAEDERAVAAFAERLAQEYELRAQVRFRACGFTVYLSRREETGEK